MHVSAMKARFRADPPVMISVHRGLWGPLPENSIAGIAAASEWDVVEIDLRLDDAGQPYLMHDGSLVRMTGALAGSDGVDLALLASLKLKEGAGGADAGSTNEPVPRLASACAALNGSDAVFDFDVKRIEDIEAVAAAVADMGHQNLGTLKIDVADSGDLARLKELEATYDIMVMPKVKLRGEDDLAVFEKLQDEDVAAAEVWFASFEVLQAACLIGRDIRVGVYTLDGIHCCGCSDARAVMSPDDVWGRLIDCGVGLIMTDKARELRHYLQNR